MNGGVILFIQHIKNYLWAWFSFPAQKAYCQMSTISNGAPHIRTMELFDVTEEGYLILLSLTYSKKWEDLQGSPRVALCMLNSDCGQIVVEGKARLISITNDLNLTHYYWNSFLSDSWRQFYLSRAVNTNPKSIPSSFGIIQIIPDAWEIFEINKEDFLKSTRKRLQLDDAGWTKDELPLLQ